MSLQDKDSHLPGWSCSKTALDQDDAVKLLKEFAELKRKERKNDPKVLQMKKKYRLRASCYPSPANILHTGRQLPRTPGPGVLPLLPSQNFETRVDVSESFQLPKGIDNTVPSGRQLPRTPISAKPEQSNVLQEIQPHVKDGGSGKSAQEVERTVNNSICDVAQNEIKNNQQAGKKKKTSRQSGTRQGLENVAPCDRMSGQLESLSEQMDVNNRRTPSHRRISELPVQGLNRMRISGVLKKMPGCEWRNEDLEFLKQLEQQEKIKILKTELLRLRKELTATNQDKELIIAKKAKIDDDIEKMKCSLDRTVHLGRAFLSRTQDSGAADRSADEVLKLLNIMTIQREHQEERRQLVAAQTELTRRKQEAANKTSHVEDKKRLLAAKMESNEQQIKEIQCRIQQFNKEVSSIQTQIEEAEKDKLELEASIQQKRQQIVHYVQCSAQDVNPSEMEERTQRRLQRILHRKNIYLEREKILRELKQDLK